MALYDQALEATVALQKRTTLQPAVALILGSGLGELANEIEDAVVVPYSEIPHFARSTVSGHAGRLVVGTLEGVAVVAMQGRFHLYEGYDLEKITLPVRVMWLLGARTLIVTNAAGGVNPAYQPGDFMVLRDHIALPGLSGMNPLLGPNDERFGPRFPPLARAYDEQLRAIALNTAAAVPGVKLHEGIYTMVAGPSFETNAELRYLRLIGTDAVGMSTVPEVIVARHMGMRVLGISLITNMATGEENASVINHTDVLSVANNARATFMPMMRKMLVQL